MTEQNTVWGTDGKPSGGNDQAFGREGWGIQWHVYSILVSTYHFTTVPREFILRLEGNDLILVCYIIL